MIKERELRTSIIDVGRRLYEKSMVAANDGNISVRAGESFIVTPAGVCKGDMEASSLVKVDADGKKVSWSKTEPSSESGMHIAIYGEREDVNAVVHAHPIYATAFATARIPLDRCVLPEVVGYLGAIPLIEYATPGTPELTDVLKPHLKGSNVFSLANHGIVTVAGNLMDAYYIMERVEHFAHILFAARTLGGEILLSDDEVERLSEALGGELPGIQCVPRG